MALPLWRSRYSINLMLPKDERKYAWRHPVLSPRPLMVYRAMLARFFFNDYEEIKDSTNKNRRNIKSGATTEVESEIVKSGIEVEMELMDTATFPG